MMRLRGDRRSRAANIGAPASAPARVAKTVGLFVLGLMAIVGLTVLQYGILPLIIGGWILAAMLIWLGERLWAGVRRLRAR